MFVIQSIGEEGGQSIEMILTFVSLIEADVFVSSLNHPRPLQLQSTPGFSLETSK